MTTKRLLNPNATNKNRSNSRSKSRTKLQGRQFRKIKSAAVDVGVQKKSNASAKETSSAGGHHPRDKQRPIIDMSSLRRDRGGRPGHGNSGNTKNKISNERVVAGEAGAMSTFTRTTAAESDSDEERRVTSHSRRQPQQRRQRPSASGGHGVSRATASSPSRRISHGDSKIKTKRRSPPKTTSARGGDLSRSSGDASRSSSHRGINKGVNAGAIVPYRPPVENDSKSSISDDDEDNNPETKRCSRHPSIILQEKIYDRWLVLRSDCPLCAEQGRSTVVVTGNQHGSGAKLSGETPRSGGTQKSGEAKRRGFMKRLGERSRQVSRPRSKPIENRAVSSPPPSSRALRAPSPVRSFGSSRHGSSPVAQSRSASRGRSSSTSPPPPPWSRRSSSKDSYTRPRSPRRASSPCRSISPPPPHRLSDDKPSFRQRRRSISFSPPRTRSQQQQQRAPSVGPNKRFTSDEPRGRAARGVVKSNNNNDNNNSYKTALVVRQRSPSPSNSVELNPHRFPWGKTNGVHRGGGSSSSSSLSPPSSDNRQRQTPNNRQRRPPSRGRSSSSSSNSMGRHRSNRRQGGSVERSLSQCRGGMSRSSSPCNSIGRRPVNQRLSSVARSLSQRRGSITRSSSPCNSIGRRPQTHRNSMGRSPSQRRGSRGRSPSERRGPVRRSISPQNSVQNPHRRGDYMGRSPSQLRGRVISPGNSIGGLNRRGDSIGRSQSQRRGPMRRSVSPQNSIGRLNRLGDAMGRSQSQRRGPMRRPISPQNSIGRLNRRGDSMGRSQSQRRGPMRRSISPQNSIGRLNRRGDSMGRSQSQRRGPLKSSRSFSPSNSMRRPQGQRRSQLTSSRSFSPFNSTGRPNRDGYSVGPSQNLRRSSLSSSISPQNSIARPNRRKSSIGRSRSQRRGTRSRSSSPQNSLGRPIQPLSRRSRRSRSRSPSPYSFMGNQSRSRSPYNSMSRRIPGGYSSPRSRSLCSSTGSSCEFHSQESSNADYFDDQHGEVVLHVKKEGDGRPSVISKRIDSFDDFFAPALDGRSPARKRNSFNESFDRMPDRDPPSRRRNSFNESFDRIPPRNFESRPNNRGNSFEDSFERMSPASSPGRRPTRRTKNSFRDSVEGMSNPPSYHRDTSFDRMRSLDRMAKRMSRQSVASVNDASGEITSNLSVGMEWSDHNKVKSKSNDLSLLIQQLNRPSRISGGRSVVSSISRISGRSAVSSASKQRRSVVLDRSSSPLPHLKGRAPSSQADQRMKDRSRSASAGPGLRGGDNKSVGSSHRGNSAAQRMGKEYSVDMANVNMALKKIAALPHVRSEGTFPLPEREYSSQRLPNGSGSTGPSLKSPNKSTPQVLSESNFPLPVKYQSPRRSSNGAGSVGSRKTKTATKERHYESLQRVPSDSSFPWPVKQLPSPHSHSQFPKQKFEAEIPSLNSPHSSPPLNQHRGTEGHPNRSSIFPPPPPPPPPRAVMPSEPLPPYQNQPQMMNELMSPEHDDWRKYQVGASSNPNPRKGMEDNNIRSVTQPRQQGPEYQEDASGSLGVVREDIDRHGLTADQQEGADWMTYKVGDSKNAKSEPSGNRSLSSGRKGKSKMFGRTPQKQTTSDRQAGKTVKQMPFTDQFGDFGLYTGQVDDDGRPHGKGSMKYDNGVFYEGTWTNGCQDQKAASQYGRIRGGFTSWQGQGKHATKSGMVLPWNARKNDTPDPNSKTNVRGMEWTDLNGDSGRYTGEINSDRMPHGFGVMKYDFGLIAEGEWNNGVLKEGPQDRMISAAASMLSGARSVAGSMSIGPGMSVGPGVRGFSGASVGPMSVGPMSVGPMSVGGAGMSIGPGSSFSGHIGGVPMMYPRPLPFGGMNPAMMGRAPNTAQQHLLIAQQNAAMKSMGAMMYGGGSVVYGGLPGPMMHQGQMPPPMMQMPMPPMQIMQGVPSPEHNRDKPPISEIKIPP